MGLRFLWHSMPSLILAEDLIHSESEKRYFCFGTVGGDILTVRFTYRGSVIRIIWRRFLVKRKGNL